jgi:CubicO group peptidase (beta-lactamase class C family)
MHRAMTASRLMSRRSLLRATAGVATAAAAVRLPSSPALAAPQAPQTATRPGSQAGPSQTSDPLLRALDEKIEAGMARYHIPGVAVGVFHNGREYVRGYGVTNVDYPQPVDGDTLFRIGSTTKTFTGTTVMRLVEQGMLDLNAPVRRYLPGLQLADESVAARVTVRQLLNHSAGWLGDGYADLGRGQDALAKYVAGMRQLPQLTPVGQVFAYNNAAVNLAGYLIATVAGKPYEEVVQELLLDPLGLEHTGFFTDTLVGYNIAASHAVEDDQVVVQPALWIFPQSLNPTGGLISSARDQLYYARFHLGDGTAADGARLLTPRSLPAMRSDLGPGGTLVVEIDGVGVTWWRRRTAEGVPVFHHGGSWQGQESGFVFVPERGFAMTLLTNSTGGSKLVHELFFTDWALRELAGLSDPPAVPRTLSPAQLAPYEGRYEAWTIPPFGAPDEFVQIYFEIKATDGALRARSDDDAELTLAFYRDDYVLATDEDGLTRRADFVRGPDGRIAWFRERGRIFAQEA